MPLSHGPRAGPLALLAVAALLRAAALPAQQLRRADIAADQEARRHDAHASHALPRARLPVAFSEPPRRLWPYYLVGGLALGAGVAAAHVYSRCPRPMCGDEPRSFELALLVPPSALLGGILGGFIGRDVDRHRYLSWRRCRLEADSTTSGLTRPCS